MRKYITGNTNKIAWAFKKAFNMTWGEAFRMALQVNHLPEQGVMASTSVFGEWKRGTVYSVAGHFYGLSKAYSEIGDQGRSIAMGRVAKAFYFMHDKAEIVTFKSLRQEKFFGASVMQEVLDYFAASAEAGFTPRTVSLVDKGADNYRQLVKRCTWSF